MVDFEASLRRQCQLQSSTFCFMWAHTSRRVSTPGALVALKVGGQICHSYNGATPASISSGRNSKSTELLGEVEIREAKKRSLKYLIPDISNFLLSTFSTRKKEAHAQRTLVCSSQKIAIHQCVETLSMKVQKTADLLWVALTQCEIVFSSRTFRFGTCLPHRGSGRSEPVSQWRGRCTRRQVPRPPSGFRIGCSWSEQGAD